MTTDIMTTDIMTTDIMTTDIMTTDIVTTDTTTETNGPQGIIHSYQKLRASETSPSLPEKINACDVF